MKKRHQPAFSPRTLTEYALFGLLALASPSLSAQTFTGQKFLDKIPASFRAIIKANAQKDAILIRLENHSAKAVRIQLLNQAQQPVYDDYVTKAEYYARWDVSALPAGTYTIALVSRTARQTQPFLIEWTPTRRIVMATPPTKPDSALAANVLLGNDLD